MRIIAFHHRDSVEVSTNDAPPHVFPSKFDRCRDQWRRSSHAPTSTQPKALPTVHLLVCSLLDSVNVMTKGAPLRISSPRFHRNHEQRRTSSRTPTSTQTKANSAPPCVFSSRFGQCHDQWRTSSHNPTSTWLKALPMTHIIVFHFRDSVEVTINGILLRVPLHRFDRPHYQRHTSSNCLL